MVELLDKQLFNLIKLFNSDYECKFVKQLVIIESVFFLIFLLW